MWTIPKVNDLVLEKRGITARMLPRDHQRQKGGGEA